MDATPSDIPVPGRRRSLARAAPIAAAALGGAALADAPAATAPDAAAAADEPALATRSEVRFTFTPYLWLVSLDGETAVDGFSTDVDADFVDIVEEADTVLGFMGQLEVGTDDWSVFLNGSWVHVGIDGARGTTGGSDVVADVDSDLGWIELGVALPLLDTTRTPGTPRPGRLDAYAGARVTFIDLELETDAALFGVPVADSRRDLSEAWVEPFIGLRGRTAIAKGVVLQARGDVGGFGAGSDFAWQAEAAIGFEFDLFGADAAGFAGYRAIGQDYEDGGFEWDVIAHGPMLGLEIRF